MRPDSQLCKGDFDWGDMRDPFFSGFHHMIRAFASAGNNLPVEHIVEKQSWALELFGLLKNFDLFIVSVRCPDEILLNRELERNDRTVGEAMFHMKTYDLVQHHIEIDSTKDALSNAHFLADAWQARAEK